MASRPTYDSRYREFAPSEDFFTAVSRGRVDGVTAAAIAGRRSGMAISTAYDLCPLTTFTILTAASPMQIVSASASDTAAGTGARTVLLTGLNASYEVITETVTLNGTTPVAIAGAFMRINGAQVVTSGSTGSNVGNITVSVIAGGAEVVLLPATYSRSMTALYTVPAAYNAYIVDLVASQTTMAATTDFCSFQVRTGAEDGTQVSRLVLTTSHGNATVSVRPQLMGFVPARSTVSVRVPACSASQTGHIMMWLLLSPV